jgi:hypothetical protein
MVFPLPCILQAFEGRKNAPLNPDTSTNALALNRDGKAMPHGDTDMTLENNQHAKNTIPEHEVSTDSVVSQTIRLRAEDRLKCEVIGGGDLLCRFASGSLSGVLKVANPKAVMDRQPSAVEVMIDALEFVEADKIAEYKLALYSEGSLVHPKSILFGDEASLAAVARLICDHFHMNMHPGADYELLKAAQRLMGSPTKLRS